MGDNDGLAALVSVPLIILASAANIVSLVMGILLLIPGQLVEDQNLAGGVSLIVLSGTGMMFLGAVLALLIAGGVIGGLGYGIVKIGSSVANCA